MNDKLTQHEGLMFNLCPEFKALVAPYCVEIPVQKELAKAILLTIQDLNAAIDACAMDGSDESADRVNAYRQELLGIWADHCITSADMATVGHGYVLVPLEDITFQFMKTSITHPVRKDLVMHAFSFAAFKDADSKVVTLLGEDCGVHFTSFRKDPNPEDFTKIETAVKSHEQMTFDDYLNIFKD